jgi:choline dehydrogenase-like flavoprotein
MSPSSAAAPAAACRRDPDRMPASRWLVEEGPLKTSSDFKHARGRCLSAALPGVGGAQDQADKAINILQGRCVGGSTTVNWTSSFRTPAATLALLAARVRPPTICRAEGDVAVVRGDGTSARHPPGPFEPNENNKLLRQGCLKSWASRWRHRAQRQGLLEPRLLRHGLPDQCQAVDAGDDHPGRADSRRAAGHHLRAERLIASPAAHCRPRGRGDEPDGIHPGLAGVRIRAKHFVVAAGAIGSPALLLRSGVPDPSGCSASAPSCIRWSFRRR